MFSRVKLYEDLARSRDQDFTYNSVERSFKRFSFNGKPNKNGTWYNLLSLEFHFANNKSFRGGAAAVARLFFYYLSLHLRISILLFIGALLICISMMKASFKPIVEREEYNFDSFRRELLGKNLTTVHWVIVELLNARRLESIFPRERKYRKLTKKCTQHFWNFLSSECRIFDRVINSCLYRPLILQVN